MYCSKCKKEISNSSKFCKYCGNSIDNNIQKDTINNVTDNKFKIQRYYGVIILIGIFVGIVLLCPEFISEFPTYTLIDFIFDILDDFTYFLVQLVLLIIIIASIAISTTEIIFKCPNCKEEIKILKSKLENINDTTQTCKCSKCNKDLIFNTTDKTVNINVTADKKENTTPVNISELEELYNLKTKGIITEEEFENKKKEYLDKM